MLDNPIVQAIILGIIQGLAEFLPVSASGHLVVVPYLLAWGTPAIGLEAALQAGTLLAVIAYFARDLWYLATRSLGIATSAEGEARRARRVVGLLAVGTVPAAVVGFVAVDLIAETFALPLWIAGFFLVTAGLLASAETVRRRRAGAEDEPDPDEPLQPGEQVGRDETTVGLRDVVAIGFGQAIALLPGLSRTGATIATGMYVGLSRGAAVRFSFLLAIPFIAGVTAAQVPDALDAGGAAAFASAEALAGALAAAAAGFWAIRFLLRLVEREDLLGFARYLVLIATITLVGRLWIGPPGAI